MSHPASLAASSTDSRFGTLVEPATLQIQRLLPGPIERIWSYLTDSELRRQWLAAGDMPMQVGEGFELVWRNDELTDPPGQRPEGFGAEHRMASRITELEPMRKLAFTWQGSGDVTIELEAKGTQVLLTLTHRRITDDNMKRMVGAGWHLHLDIFEARLLDQRTEPFWDQWARLRKVYDERLAA